MLALTPQMRILVAVEAVDFRKGIDSLAELCRAKLDADPFSGCLFVFRSRSAIFIKVLGRCRVLWSVMPAFSRTVSLAAAGGGGRGAPRVHQVQVLLAAGNPEIDASMGRSQPCIFTRVLECFRYTAHGGLIGTRRHRRSNCFHPPVDRGSAGVEPVEAVARVARSGGSGSRPTARCATWCAGDCC